MYRDEQDKQVFCTLRTPKEQLIKADILTSKLKNIRAMVAIVGIPGTPSKDISSKDVSSSITSRSSPVRKKLLLPEENEFD